MFFRLFSQLRVVRRPDGWLLLNLSVCLCFSLVLALNAISASSLPQGNEAGFSESERTKQISEVHRLETQYYSLVAQGQFDDALTSIRKIMELGRGLHAEDSPYRLDAMQMLAESLAYCDQFDEAHEVARRLLQVCKESRGEKHWRTANAGHLLEEISRLENLSIEDRHRLAKARQILMNVKQLLVEGQAKQAALDAREAADIWHELLGELHTKTLEGMLDLAIAIGQQDRGQEALELYGQILKRCRSAYSEDACPGGHPQTAQALYLTANRSLRSGDTEAAERYLLECLEMRKRLYPPERYPLGHETLIHTMLSLSDSRILKGAPADQWLPLSKQSVDMAEGLFTSGTLPQGHELLVFALRKRATDLILIEETTAAQLVLERLLTLQLDYARNEMLYSESDVLVRYLDNMTSDYEKLLTLTLLEGQNDPQLLTKVYQWGVMLKSFLSDSHIRTQYIQRELSSDPKLVTLDARVRELKRKLAASLKTVSEDRDDEDAQTIQARLAQELRAAEDELMVSLHERAGESRSQSFSFAAMQDWIANRPGTAVVEIIEYRPVFPGMSESNGPNFGDARYVAFILTHGRELVVVDLGDMTTINRQVTALRDLIRRAPRQSQFADEAALEAEYAELASELRQLVFAPLEPHLQGVETICVAPDGELHRLSLQALVDDGGRYLIEQYAFGYLSASSDLLRPQPSPGEGIVVFADPAYDLDPTEHQQLVTELIGDDAADDLAVRSELADNILKFPWQRLPATAIEADLLRKLFADNDWGSVEIYTGATALEELLKLLERPRLLHLATHGFRIETTEEDGDGESHNDEQSTRVPDSSLDTEYTFLLSGFVLAGANTLLEGSGQETPSDDGWVTAEEVSMLDLLGTELVVLSTGGTGFGDIPAGESVSGLRQAFLQAGAQRLIMGLFQVPDSATEELMSELYEQVAAGTPALQALRDAQLAMITERRQQHEASHPLYWASFILVGNPD